MQHFQHTLLSQVMFAL